MSRDQNSNCQFFDVFSDSSSESFEQGNPKESKENQLVNQKNDVSGESIVEISKAISELHLETILNNSKLRFNEQQTDLETLMPEGIESMKFSTGALNRHDSSNIRIAKLNMKNQSQTLKLQPDNSSKVLSTIVDQPNNKAFINQNQIQKCMKQNDQLFNRIVSTDDNQENFIKSVSYSTPNVNQFKTESCSINTLPQYHPNQSYNNSFNNSALILQPLKSINTTNNLYYPPNYQSYYPTNTQYQPYPSVGYPFYAPNVLYAPTILVPTQLGTNSYSTSYSSSHNVMKPFSKTSSTDSLQLGSSNDEIKYLTIINQNYNFINYICSLEGCKDIQKRLHKMGIDTANYLIEIIMGLNGLESIMTDSSANYIFQKAAELISTTTKIKLFKLLGPKIHLIGCDVFGSHSIQKLISISTADLEKEILVDMISKASKILCYDSYGVYVVMKAITKIPDSQRTKLNQTLLDQLENLIKNMQGVCVVSK